MHHLSRLRTLGDGRFLLRIERGVAMTSLAKHSVLFTSFETLYAWLNKHVNLFYTGAKPSTPNFQQWVMIVSTKKVEQDLFDLNFLCLTSKAYNGTIKPHIDGYVNLEVLNLPDLRTSHGTLKRSPIRAVIAPLPRGRIKGSSSGSPGLGWLRRGRSFIYNIFKLYLS